MTSPRYTDFYNFARDFFAYSSRVFHDDEVEVSLERIEPVPLLEKMDVWCSAFTNTHTEHFQVALGKTEFHEIRTDHQFFRFAIPKCMSLVVPGMFYFSLLLVSAYLREFLRFMVHTRRCYRFYLTAYKCYLAVFKRAFEESFESRGGMEGLEKYFEELDPEVRKAEDISKASFRVVLYGDKPKNYKLVRLMIERSDRVEDFDLNEYELLLLAEGVQLMPEVCEVDGGGGDPLRYEGPIKAEHVKKRLGSDSEVVLDNDSPDEEEYSDLRKYVNVLQAGAKREMGDTLNDGLCPCCGIRCKKISLELHKKHLSLVLNGTRK